MRVANATSGAEGGGRVTDKFFYAGGIKDPKDVIPHLAKQDRHWRKGYSAYELAHSWVRANGIPAPVAAVLHQAAESL